MSILRQEYEVQTRIADLTPLEASHRALAVSSSANERWLQRAKVNPLDTDSRKPILRTTMQAAKLAERLTQRLPKGKG